MTAGVAAPPTPAWRRGARTFISALLPTFGALGLQLLAFAITARCLGVEQFGRYAAVSAVAAILVDIVGLGSSDMMMRTVAATPERTPQAFGQTLRTMAWTWPLATLGGAAFARYVLHLDLPGSLLLASIAAELTLARTQATLETLMVASRQPVRAAFVKAAAAALRLAWAGAYFVAAGQDSLHGWIVALCALAAAQLAVAAWIGVRHYGPIDLAGRDGDMKEMLSFCVVQLSRSAQSNLDRVILARFATEQAMGAYSAATRVMQVGMFPIQVVTRMLFPRFFVEAKGGAVASRRWAVRAGGIMAGVGIVSALMTALAGALAPRILGEGYRTSVGYVEVLALSMPFMALQYPAADTLTARGSQQLRTGLAFATTCVLALAIASGAWHAGADGVIWAFVAGHAITAAVYWVAALKATRRP